MGTGDYVGKIGEAVTASGRAGRKQQRLQQRTREGGRSAEHGVDREALRERREAGAALCTADGEREAAEKGEKQNEKRR